MKIGINHELPKEESETTHGKVKTDKNHIKIKLLITLN
jgi:hypothetical protein